MLTKVHMTLTALSSKVPSRAFNLYEKWDKLMIIQLAFQIGEWENKAHITTDMHLVSNLCFKIMVMCWVTYKLFREVYLGSDGSARIDSICVSRGVN